MFKITQEEGDYLLLDTQQEERSNWMIFVRPAERKSEQNLVAFQYRGDIYFATIKVGVLCIVFSAIFCCCFILLKFFFVFFVVSFHLCFSLSSPLILDYFLSEYFSEYVFGFL